MKGAGGIEWADGDGTGRLLEIIHSWRARLLSRLRIAVHVGAIEKNVQRCLRWRNC